MRKLLQSPLRRMASLRARRKAAPRDPVHTRRLDQDRRRRPLSVLEGIRRENQKTKTRTMKNKTNKTNATRRDGAKAPAISEEDFRWMNAAINAAKELNAAADAISTAIDYPVGEERKIVLLRGKAAENARFVIKNAWGFRKGRAMPEDLFAAYMDAAVREMP